MTALDRLFARLGQAAERLGRAEAERRSLSVRSPAQAWRKARLVWPLFTKG